MIKYTVEWCGAEHKPRITHIFEAESEHDAFAKAVEAHKCPTYSYIYVNWGWFGMKSFDNPHFDPNYVEPQKALSETVDESHSQQPAGSDGDVEWRENLGAAAKNIRNQVSPPQSSGWATLYRACGGIILLVGFIGTIGIAQKDEEAGFQFAIVAITLALSSFLAAFLIDVLTDMRHYLKRIAEKE